MSGKKAVAISAILVCCAIIVTVSIVVTSTKTPGGRFGRGMDSDGYALEFSDDFNTALASRNEPGISIMIAIDCSDYMAGAANDSPGSAQKYKIAYESVNQIVGMIKDLYRTVTANKGMTIRLGIMRFSDKVNVLFNLHEMDDVYFKDIEKISVRPDVFRPHGSAAIGEAIEEGVEMLVQSGTIAKHLVVITDGTNSAGADPADVLRATTGNRNNKGSKDSPVITSGVSVILVGFHGDEARLSTFGEMGSRVMYAGGGSAIAEDLKGVLLADIAKAQIRMEP